MTRRTLLLAAMAPTPAPPIQSIEAIPIRYPVTGYFKFFPKPERPAVFVKVTCEDGTTGWGPVSYTHLTLPTKA
jgi:L-alanine-DL-glutamate epimerase-like enolase superfamily enzyme